MSTVLILLFPGVVVAATSGGRSIRAGSAAHLLVVVAAALQVAAHYAPTMARLAVPGAFALGTIALTLIVWATTRSRVISAAAALGAAANLLPIAVRGAMPVSAASRSMLNGQPFSEPGAVSAKHVEMSFSPFDDPVSALADWIPVPLVDAVASPGDVLLLVALVGLGLTARQQVPNVAKSATPGSSFWTAS